MTSKAIRNGFDALMVYKALNRYLAIRRVELKRSKRRPSEAAMELAAIAELRDRVLEEAANLKKKEMFS